MRDLTAIVVHCTATPQDVKPDNIVKFWKNQNGWDNPGYHYLVEKDGTIHNLAHIAFKTNGVGGKKPDGKGKYNDDTVHISYIGGVDEQGDPLDNRTQAQKLAMYFLINELKQQKPYSDLLVLGHNDYTNKKACPSFKVTHETLKPEILKRKELYPKLWI